MILVSFSANNQKVDLNIKNVEFFFSLRINMMMFKTLV